MATDTDSVVEYYKNIYARGIWDLAFFEHMIESRLRQECRMPPKAWQQPPRND